MNDDWIVTLRVKLKNFCRHDEPEAEGIVRECLQAEGLFGVSDWPDDFEIVSVQPDGDKSDTTEASRDD